jgi:hypothetical protein
MALIFKRTRKGKDATDPSVAMLLTELKLIDDEFRRMRSEGTARVNGYLTFVTAIITAGAAYTATRKLAWWTVLTPGGTAIALLGFYIFYGMVVRDVDTDRCARATGRIRRYFTDLDSELERYLTFQSTDAPSQWVARRESVQRRMVSIVASAAGAGAVTGEVARRGIAGSVLLLVFLPVLALIYLVLGWTARRRLKQAASKAQKQQRFF